MISSHKPIVPTDLIEWRKKNGISLPAISVATKISPRYLEAIEAGKFAELPGGVYSISYIRQYARAINFDEAELVEHYRDVMMPADAANAAPPVPDTWIGRLWERIRSLHVIAAVDHGSARV